jgi:hypothetical protein
VSHQNGVRFLARVYEGPDKIQQQWITFAIWLAAAAAVVAVCGTAASGTASEGDCGSPT